jgi:hypothetical protein
LPASLCVWQNAMARWMGGLYNLGKDGFRVYPQEKVAMADALPKLDREKLRAELIAHFERTVEEVADAVDDAPTGRIIRDSEEKARDALDRFRQKVFETALQGKIDAAQAAFPPSAQRGDRQAETA